MPKNNLSDNNNKLRVEIGMVLAEFAIDLQVNEVLCKSGCGAINLAYERAEDRILSLLLTQAGGGK